MAPPHPHSSRLARGLRLALHSNLFVAVGVASLGWWVATTQGGSAKPSVLTTLFFGTLLIYNLDHLRDDRQRAAMDPHARPRLAGGRRLGILGIATVGLTVSLVYGGTSVLLMSLPAGLVGLFYGARFHSGGRRVKDLPGAKAWIVALAVSEAVLTLPLYAAEVPPKPHHVGAGVFLLTLTAINAHCFDLRDLAVDARSGAATWATRLGGGRAHSRLRLFTGCAAVGSVGLAMTGWLEWSAAATLLVAWTTLWWIRPGAPRERFGVVVDGWLLLPAGMTVIADAIRAI